MTPRTQLAVTRSIRRARCAACVLACGAVVAAKAAPTLDDDRYVPGSFADRVDLLVRDGFDRPDAALARLEGMTSDGLPQRRRVLLQAHAFIEAQAGRSAEAGEDAAQLMALAEQAHDPLAGAAAMLTRALVAETAGQTDVAADLARPALDAYQAACSGQSSTGRRDAAACDYRSTWRALNVLQRRSMSLGQGVLARGQLEAAVAIAERAGDRWRKADSLGLLAYVLATIGQTDAANRAMSEAKHIGATLGEPAPMARLLSSQARIANLHGDRRTAARLLEEALVLAERGHAARLQAMLLTNMSDVYAKLHESARALHAADAALATARRFNDQRAERILINNAGLAKIGLGRIAEGKQDLARLLDLWRASASLANEAATLREFGEALAAAGDARGALELYHRERSVSAEVMRRGREAALKEMQARYDADAKQRSIELLNRDNALKSATLANHRLLIKNWSSVVIVLAVSLAVAFGMVRHVRRMQRRLEATKVRLREASERDALTNLANRRHLHAVMERADRSDEDGAFEGAMLLVDIDHFKAINDRHGHAVGDAVLVEFGRRLIAAVRTDDLVVRWGGEEFLIVACGLSSLHAHLMAARVLEQVSGAAFAVHGHALRVTASIGYGRFPLGSGRRASSWQHGVSLVDKALYSAKSGGRNRAMGLVLPSESVPQGLVRIATNAETFQLTSPMELLQTCGTA